MPVTPLIVLLAAAALLALWGAVNAHRSSAQAAVKGSLVRMRLIAGIAALAAAACAGTALFVHFTHDSVHSRIVAQTLEQKYGVVPLDPSGIRLGEKFAALVDGAESECSVTLPDVVVCGGELLSEISSAG